MQRALTLSTLFATLAVAGLVISRVGFADTADGSTPAEETVCDTATGVAFGLCNAYCEATDCGDGSVTHTDDSGCNAIEDAFADLTGETLECGSSVPTNDCSNKCFQQAEQRYLTCFHKRIEIPKHLVDTTDTGGLKLSDTGRKIYGDTTIKGCDYDICYGTHDCESNVKTWLGSCLERCELGTGGPIIKR